MHLRKTGIVIQDQKIYELAKLWQAVRANTGTGDMQVVVLVQHGPEDVVFNLEAAVQIAADQNWSSLGIEPRP